MPRRARLDAELVRRGLARSREHASELVAAGRVTVRGMVARKPATGVEIDAPEVVAVDVGYGQLDWKLRTDDRVRVHDRTNVRSLTAETIGGQVDLVVADLS